MGNKDYKKKMTSAESTVGTETVTETMEVETVEVEPVVETKEAIEPVVEEVPEEIKVPVKATKVEVELNGFAKIVKPKSPAENTLCTLIDMYIELVDKESGKESDRKAKVLAMKDVLLYPSNANVTNSLPLYDMLLTFIAEYRKTLVVEHKALQNLQYINNKQELIRFTTIYTALTSVVDCNVGKKKFPLDISKIKRDLGDGISKTKFESLIAWLTIKEEKLNKQYA